MATLRSARTTYKNTRTTTDAWFVRVERQDGGIVRFCTSDQNVVMTNRVLSDGTTEAITSVTYYSASGYNPSAVAHQDSLQAGIVDIEGILDAVTSSGNVARSIEHVPESATASSTDAGSSEVYHALITNSGTGVGAQWWPESQPTNTIPAWVQVKFNQPALVNKLVFNVIHSSNGTGAPSIGISHSDDGQRFSEIIPIETQSQLGFSGSMQTVTFTFPATYRVQYMRFNWGASGDVGLGKVRWVGLRLYHDTTADNTGTVARTDIENGLYENAKVFVFTTDYTDPYEDDEKMISGFWGNIKLLDGLYVAQFMSKLDALSYSFGRKYQSSCDAVFGSFRCGVNLTPWTWDKDVYATARVTGDAASGTWIAPTTPNGYIYYASVGGLVGASEPTWPTVVGNTVTDGAVTWTAVRMPQTDLTITAVTDSRTLTIAGLVFDANDTWSNGKLEFTDNALKGVKTTIKSQTAAVVVLSQPLKNLPTIGDAVTVIQGCRKRFTTDCDTKFDNQLNFQGFPHIPGSRIVGKIGGQE